MSKVQKDRPRLGRGLSSLISVGGPIPHEPVVVETPHPPAAAPAALTEHPLRANSSPLEVPLHAITPNPHQPRKQFADGPLQELAASIKSTGLIQPLVVRQQGDQYELIAGERRWRAAKLAGLKAVPVLIREVDGFTQAQMALIENIQREDLNPMDRAGAYRALMDQLGLTQAELSSRLGEDRSSIANHLRLLDLAEPVRLMISSGALSLGHAKVLASVSEPLEQERLANLILSQSLSVRNLERIIAEGATPKTRQPPAPSPHVTDVEKSITRQLGMKAQLKSVPGKGRGRLVLHYTSLDQFDELMERLGVKLASV